MDQQRIRRNAAAGQGSGAAGAERTPAPSSIPNSVFAADSPSREDLEAAMSAKMVRFRTQQLPSAEQEADRLGQLARGAATPAEVKSRLGAELGADFTSVRFHTGPDAEEAAGSIGAKAYTVGRDVYFGAGGFDPAVAAHELVHTVQQGAVAGEGVSVSAPAGQVQMKPEDPLLVIRQEILDAEREEKELKKEGRLAKKELRHAGTGNVALHKGPVDAIDDTRRRFRQAVGGIGIIEQHEAEPLLLYQQGITALPVVLIAVGTGTQQRERIEHQQGAVETATAAVETMVVCGKQYIESALFYRIKKFIGRREGRIAPIGLAGERDFEVGNSQVGLGNQRLHSREAVAVIIPAATVAGGIDLCLVLHEVSCKNQCNPLLRGEGYTAQKKEGYEKTTHSHTESF